MRHQRSNYLVLTAPDFSFILKLCDVPCVYFRYDSLPGPSIE